MDTNFFAFTGPRRPGRRPPFLRAHDGRESEEMTNNDRKAKGRPEESDALRIMRTIWGGNGKDLAEASGLASSSISDYERGRAAPSRRTLERFSEVMGLPGFFVGRILNLIREGRAVITAGREPDDRFAAARQAVERVAGEGAEAAYGFLRSLLEEVTARATVEDGRRRARETWTFLAPFSPTRQQRLLAEIPEAKTWQLCEVVCEASVKAAANDAAKAVELAELALAIAQDAPAGVGVTPSQFQGYAWAFLGNARRVHGDLPGADDAFVRARELWADERDGLELLDASRVLDLEASLRSAQRRLPEALDLLDRALGAAPGPGASARILIKRAKALEEAGRYEEALISLRRAQASLAEAHDDHLDFALRFNVLVNLVHLGCAAEAESGLPEVRTLAQRLGNALDFVRLRCLEGEIAAGLGRFDEAVTSLMSARAEFASRRIAFDTALVSLKLAEIYAAQGHTEMVKALARQMAPVFQDQGVHEEVKKALAFFRRAAEQEAVTVQVAQRLTQYLHRAQHDPKLRFEIR